MTVKQRQIYLDYSATTPLDRAVADEIRRHFDETHGNASSVHSFGRSAKVVLEESRETMARSLGAETGEIFFTSGGTESDNHALIGTAFAHRRENGKDHILVSSIEHHAVLDTAEYLREQGFSVSRIPVDGNGVVDPTDVERMITGKTSLLSVMHANNETGVLQPIREIASIAKKNAITFHSDTVQTVGKIPVTVNDLGVDLLAVSAHKIYGPKGIGAIYIRKGTNVDPLVHGGSQERNVRAGTENIPLIAGFAKAVTLSETYRDPLFLQAKNFSAALAALIRETVPGVIFNSSGSESLPHILSVSLDSSLHTNIESESLLMNMDLRGVAVSSGSACTSGSIQPSHVLLAMGRDKKTTQTTVRFSFGKFTTFEEVMEAGAVFCSIVQSLQKK